MILTTCSFKVNICRINEIEPKYYADGEDAYAMKRDLVVWSKQQVPSYNWMSEKYVHHLKDMKLFLDISKEISISLVVLHTNFAGY